MIVMKALRLKLVAAALLLGVSLSGQATTVTLFGTDVSFTFDDATLFGPGIVVGNSLIFQPPAFKAESLNGAGVVTASETLIIDVEATTPGYDITSLAMQEQGDYIWKGVGASVAASGRLGVVGSVTCGIFACNDEGLFNVAPLGDTGGATVGWTGGTSVNLADTAGWGSDTSLQISFQNNLSATTQNSGEQAFIQKKLGGVGLIVNPVPVPAALWLFGSGLLALAGMSRRRSRG